MSSHLVSDESGAVECGIAVAPVTNFKYYGEFQLTIHMTET